MSQLPPRPRSPFGRPNDDDDQSRPALPSRPAFGSRLPSRRPEPTPEPEPVYEAPVWQPSDNDTYEAPAEEEIEEYAETDEVEDTDYLDEDEDLEEVEGYIEDNSAEVAFDHEVEAYGEVDEADLAPAQPTAHADDDDEEPTREDLELEDTILSFSPSVRAMAQRLLSLILSDDSSEVLLNGPQNIVYVQNGERFFVDAIKFPDVETYHKVINAVVLPYTTASERIGRPGVRDLIEGQMEYHDPDDPTAPPLLARITAFLPRGGAAIITIAKKARVQFDIDAIQRTGAMTPQMAGFLKALARGRATVVFSGGTGSGKTTLLEAMSHEFDVNDRVAVVEDIPELRIPLQDVVPMLSTAAKPGQDPKDRVTLEWLVSLANRMRFTRIIVGEIRGAEMAEFLVAANSGADGSMTTMHADSPRGTIQKMITLANKSDNAKNEKSIQQDIALTVQVIVQLAKIDNRRVVTAIEEVSNTVGNGGNSTQPIFVYNRNTGKHEATYRPSDELKAFLGQRGVQLNNAWFSKGA